MLSICRRFVSRLPPVSEQYVGALHEIRRLQIGSGLACGTKHSRLAGLLAAMAARDGAVAPAGAAPPASSLPRLMPTPYATRSFCAFGS